VKQIDIEKLPYRPNVGVVVMNRRGEIFAGKRLDNPGNAWQMPQGGVDKGEANRDAAYRELTEETGISVDSVAMLAETKNPIAYDLPADLITTLWGGKYRGQKQQWYLMRFLGEDSEVNIGGFNGEPPEFSEWCWMTPDQLIESIVPFKRALYQAVLGEFANHIGPAQTGHI
jgi:putative (di)nucleoside polyphosphate hydrolase